MIFLNAYLAIGVVFNAPLFFCISKGKFGAPAAHIRVLLDSSKILYALTFMTSVFIWPLFPILLVKSIFKGIFK